MSEPFEDYIKSAPKIPASLALTHATDFEAFGRMLRSDEIGARLCPVYSQDLVYFFYGRPSYRVNSGEFTYQLPALAPVCLLLDAKALGAPIRVMPFDSGGFPLYAEALHKSYTRSDFEVSPIPESYERLVGAFYASTQSYYDKCPMPNLTFGVLQGRANAYYLLITNGLAQEYDDRCSAIEVQFDHSISLTGKVRAVVMPEQAVSDPTIAEALKKWDAIALTYKLTGRFRPIEFLAKIFELVEDFARRDGAFS
jgi:hypothetical protein